MLRSMDVWLNEYLSKRTCRYFPMLCIWMPLRAAVPFLTERYGLAALTGRFRKVNACIGQK